MPVKIVTEAFNPWEILQSHEQNLQEKAGKCGALSNFIGRMRDYNEGDDVTQMYLEHYPAMTTAHLNTICEEAMQKWDILDCLIVHRVGEINPTDTIVLVAAWAGHRGSAFSACRYLIEELKHRAPFWKRETLLNGDVRWVEKNTSGDL